MTNINMQQPSEFARQIFIHIIMPHLDGICSLSPLDPAMTLQFAKARNTKMTTEVSKVLRLQQKNASSCERDAKKWLLSHGTTFNTFAVTTSATSATQNEVTRWLKWPSLQRRRGHSDLTLSTADGCEYGCGRLQTVAQRPATTPFNAQTPWIPCYTSGKKLKQFCKFLWLSKNAWRCHS